MKGIVHVGEVAEFHWFIPGTESGQGQNTGVAGWISVVEFLVVPFSYSAPLAFPFGHVACRLGGLAVRCVGMVLGERHLRFVTRFAGEGHYFVFEALGS